MLLGRQGSAEPRAGSCLDFGLDAVLGRWPPSSPSFSLYNSPPWALPAFRSIPLGLEENVPLTVSEGKNPARALLNNRVLFVSFLSTSFSYDLPLGQ